MVKPTVVSKKDLADLKSVLTPETKADPKPATITVIKVLKRDAKFRGARQKWYEAIMAADGKSVKEFTDSCIAKPPSTPTKGILAGKCEPPAGWLSYFKRNAIIAMPDEQVKA